MYQYFRIEEYKVKMYFGIKSFRSFQIKQEGSSKNPYLWKYYQSVLFWI